MFGKRKRSEIRGTTIEENYTSHKNPNADAKTKCARAMFFSDIELFGFSRVPRGLASTPD